MNKLEKIDLIRERVDVSFAEAQQALTEADGDIVAALIVLEKEGCNWESRLEEQSQKLWTSMKKLIHKGNKTKIKVVKNGDTIFQIPASVGVAALLGTLSSNELTMVAGVGTVAALISGCHMELCAKDKEEQDGYIFIS